MASIPRASPVSALRRRDVPPPASGAASRPTLRERKKARVRADLVRAASRLFDGKGFERVTVAEIAAEAHVSPRTFFRYFRSKEGVVFDGAGDDLRGLLECLRRRPRDEPNVTALLHGLLSYAEAQQVRAERLRSVVRLVFRTPSLMRAWAVAIEAPWTSGIAAELASRGGRTAPSRCDEALAAMSVGTLPVALRAWADDPDGSTFDGQLRAVYSEVSREMTTARAVGAGEPLVTTD